MKKYIAVAVLALSTVFAAPAQASSPVDPALTIVGFGANFGVPTGCQLATAFANSFSADTVRADVSPVAEQVNASCDQIAVAGEKATVDAKKAGLGSQVNPFFKPAVGQVAGAVSKVGTDYGTAVAPFGPTIAGLGGTINFFQG